MKRIVVILAVLIALLSFSATPALAHVHAITPLGTCTVDNAEHSGAKTAEGSPLDAPWPIPSSVGQPDVGFCDGGKSAPVQCP